MKCFPFESVDGVWPFLIPSCSYNWLLTVKSSDGSDLRLFTVASSDAFSTSQKVKGPQPTLLHMNIYISIVLYFILL